MDTLIIKFIFTSYNQEGKCFTYGNFGHTLSYQ